MLLPAVSACQPPPRAYPLPALSLESAARIVNANIEGARGTLQAVGSVDGRVRAANGTIRAFSVSSVLFYCPQPFDRTAGPLLRMDLKKLGETQLLVGSNRDRYWQYSAQDKQYHCGWHGDDDPMLSDLPIKPRQLVHALGLTPIALGPAAPGTVATFQRIEQDVQQVLFLVEDSASGRKLEREYWLDRYPPRLVRRVVFRNAMGGIEMQSQLSDYRRIGDNGLFLPHRIVVDWADSQMQLKFSIRRWRIVEQVGPDSIQFALPKECGAW